MQEQWNLQRSDKQLYMFRLFAWLHWQDMRTRFVKNFKDDYSNSSPCANNGSCYEKVNDFGCNCTLASRENGVKLVRNVWVLAIEIRRKKNKKGK